MDDPILITLISALGIKKVWNIIKKKIEINTLIEENIQLKVKIAKMEERIIFTAKNRIKK